MNEMTNPEIKTLQSQFNEKYPISKERLYEHVKPFDILKHYLLEYNARKPISDGSVIEHPELGNIIVNRKGADNLDVSTTYDKHSIELDAVQTVQFMYRIEDEEEAMRRIVKKMGINFHEKAFEIDRTSDVNASENKAHEDNLNSRITSNKASLKDNLIQVRTANQRLRDAQNQPELKQIFGSYWQNSEVTILAGDTGVGKTLLGVGIADALSTGRNEYLNQKVDVQPKGEKVLYFDFELGDRGFEIRYRGYEFSDNLEFANINQDYYGNEELCINSIRKEVSRSQAKIIIIDNISALSLKSTADADEALSIIKSILELARKHELSILILAHVPKGKSGKLLDADDVAGSKLITNHVDSVFFIARSKVDNQRYLKQVKARDCEQRSSCDLIEIVSEPYLNFEYLGEYSEYDLLPDITASSGKVEIDWDFVFRSKDKLTTKEIKSISMTEYKCKERTVEQQIRNAIGSHLEKVKYGVYRLMNNDS
jgi:RecA-family ATPase